jgi:ferredoxin
VCTYGGGPGRAFKSLKEILEAGDLKLWGKYGVHMPQNAFRKSWEKYPKIYASASKQIKKIAGLIDKRKGRRPLKDILLEAILLPLGGLVETATRRWLGECSGSSPDLPMADLIHRADRIFSINGDCNGCGICARICPADNIRIEEDRPVRSGKCENCIACYNWCPRRTITGGMAREGYFYSHPGATVADMVAQKNGAG